MNGNGQMEVHYINTGFPYTVTESFMNFFEGLTHVPLNYGHAVPMHDQVFLVVQCLQLYVPFGCSCIWIGYLCLLVIHACAFIFPFLFYFGKFILSS